MEPRNLGRCNSSGNEGHGVHVCRKCGWPFPNPHPSAKHRRAHKRVCGTIEGYKLGDYGESNTRLDGSDDDSKTPSLKTMEGSISRGSSGVGSRSGRSTRSNEDVFSDAVMDFDDFPGSADSVSVVGEPDNVIQDVSKDDGVSRLPVEKTITDAGDLYPPDKAGLEAVEFHNPEGGRVEVDKPSQHHLSGTNLDSALISVLDSEEKGSTEGALDVASVHTEDAVETSEAISLPLMVEGGGLESVLADDATEVTARRGDGFHDKNERCPDFDFVAQINSSEKGGVEAVVEKEPEDISSIPSEDTGKTSQEVKVDCMEVIEKQGDGFGAKNDFSPKGDFVGQNNGLENFSGEAKDVNVEPGSSVKVDEGHGICSDDVQFVVCSGVLPLREHPEVMLGDHVAENLPGAITPSDAQEGKSVENGKVCVTKDILSGLPSLVEPSEGFNGNSEDIVMEANIHQEDNFVQVSLEKKLESADGDTTGLGSVVAPLDNESNAVGHGGMFTSTAEQNPQVLVDTSFHSIQPIHDSLENDSELSVATETLSASNDYITSEKDSLEGIDRGNCDVRSREVEGNNGHGREEAAASEPSNASLLKGEFQMNMTRDPEAAVKELSSSVEQPVGGGCAGAVSKSVAVTDNDAPLNNIEVSEGPRELQNFGERVADEQCIGNVNGDSLDMIEQKYHDENCVQKASDSHSVGVTDNGARLNNIEVSEGSKELRNFGGKVADEQRIGNVDFGLISDNDDSIDLTQNTANCSSSRVHTGAVSTVEDHSSKETDGRASGFANLDRNLVKQEEAISELDTRADSSSQSDSLECNWGSVSDAQATADSKSQPSQASVKVEEAGLQPKSNNQKSDMFQPTSFMTSVEEKAEASDQNVGVSQVQLSQKPGLQAGWLPSQTSGANEPSGRKRDTEIIEKVMNWSTLRQHVPLKSYLGESSPNAKDNPPFGSQKTKRTTAKDSKATADEAVMGEWNSPARYPANIKREKGKARNRAWVPFICCSSVQTS